VKQTMFLLEQCTVLEVITKCLKCSLLDVTQAQNRFDTCLLPCRQHLRSQPRNLLFQCIKSLLLLWQPCSWF